MKLFQEKTPVWKEFDELFLSNKIRENPHDFGAMVWSSIVLREWVEENFVPKEELLKRHINILKEVETGLFDSTPYVQKRIKNLREQLKQQGK